MSAPVIAVERILALITAADQIYEHGGDLLAWFRQQEPALNLKPAEPIDVKADAARQSGVDRQAEAVKRANEKLKEDK